MRQNNGHLEPTPEAIKALDQLSKNNPNNIVFVVSTDSKQVLHKWYSSKAQQLGLAAENGFFWRWTSLDKKEDDWNRLIEIDDL